MLEYQYRGLLHSHIGVMYLNILDTGASSSRGIVCIWTSGCAEGKMRDFSWEEEEEGGETGVEGGPDFELQGVLDLKYHQRKKRIVDESDSDYEYSSDSVASL